jgi:hypothetical protein
MTYSPSDFFFILSADHVVGRDEKHGEQVVPANYGIVAKTIEEAIAYLRGNLSGVVYNGQTYEILETRFVNVQQVERVYGYATRVPASSPATT